MGVVKGITATTFPSRGRDEGQKIALKTRWGIFPATIVRQDNDHPFNEVWKIDAKNLPRRYFASTDDLYVSRQYVDDFQKRSPICAKGEDEGQFVDVVFDHDTQNKCEGVVMTHRDLLVVILLTTGPHEGRYVTSTECQYATKPRKVKELIDED
ncbi:hypothetical protein HOT49_gp305 [Erwinia phage vB_EamM_Alexandra]|uniref:Uncharacterized protein n=1 Tax=Erwinia phage vB_EamM_Alexandra TaxID=2201424 RepID=A0A2Z4QF64_9CAUD|nr:hypothetical protein HOT49_gp305 [Erwinia phage vB_EamM_Alexandra]AWY08564.1 hypothetical protein Alexandra_308 [Erwinia phage vB_EamM_Alexandra]